MALVGPRLGMTRSGCGMVCGMGKVRWSAARAATRRVRAKPATSQHGERDGERERGRHIVLICCPWFETYATQVQCCIIVLNDRLALCMDYGRPRLGMSNVVPHLKVWPVDGLWMREREISGWPCGGEDEEDFPQMECTRCQCAQCTNWRRKATRILNRVRERLRSVEDIVYNPTELTQEQSEEGEARRSQREIYRET